MLANGVCHSLLQWLENGFASKPAPTTFAQTLIYKTAQTLSNLINYVVPDPALHPALIP